MAPQNVNEMNRKVTEQTTLISGLLKMVALAAADCAEDKSWPGLGSLDHMKAELVSLLVGFEYQGDEDDDETIKRIVEKAKTLADSRFVNGSKQHRVATGDTFNRRVWVSTPE